MKPKTRKDLAFIGLVSAGISTSIIMYLIALALGIPHSEIASIIVGFISGVAIDRILTKE